MPSIEWRGDTACRIVVSSGYLPNGKKERRTKTLTFPADMTKRQKEKEAQRQAVLFEQQVQNGTYLDGEKITFGEFAEKWLADYAEKQLAPATLSRYKLLLERILVGLGEIKLAKLQPHHILEFYNNLSEDGIRQDNKYALAEPYVEKIQRNKTEIAVASGVNVRTLKQLISGQITNRKSAVKIASSLEIPLERLFVPVIKKSSLSPRTILHHHRLLSSMLTTAVQWQLIAANPCERVKAPRVEEQEAAHYEDYQVVKLFSLLSNEPLKYQCAIYIALYGGLRLAEIVGLDWQDIDFEKQTLTVSKSWQYLSESGSFDKNPKNKTSKRTIDLSASVINILRQYRVEQSQERLKLGNLWNDSGKIFVQWNGVPMFPKTPSFWFAKWIQKTGLPKITFHQLRHTNASILISEGVDVITVSKRLGHSKPSTKTDIYSHAIAKRNREAADKLDNLFNPSAFENAKKSQ